MAELLIRTVSQPMTGDPLVDRHRSGRGCVIVVMPDGHPWSAAERTAPFWRIVKVPGVPPEALTQFTRRDVGYGEPEAEAVDRTLRRWSDEFDIDAFDALGGAKKAEIATHPGKALAHILKVRKGRPVLHDPDLIGPKPGMVKGIGKP